RNHRVLSFLPLCHIYERTAVYQFMYKGTEIYYAESLKSILNNFQEIRPDGTTVVPRVLEKILRGVLSRADESFFLKRKAIRWCVKFGCNYMLNEKRGYYYKLRHLLADLMVFRSVRHFLGGRIKYVGLGGAPVSEKIESFYWAAGIPVYQGYGLTECAPLVALNSGKKENVRLGTVGRPVKNVTVRIAGDGEILVKGPNVMMGYYKDVKLTNQSVKNGYLHTGDLGEMTADGYLKITGRKKEMFKTSYGKYIVPQAIESLFTNSQYIDHIMIIGEGKHYAAAIISPDFAFFRSNVLRRKTATNEEIITQKPVIHIIVREIGKANRSLGKTEQIKRYLLVPDSWSPDTGEISVTQKLRRNTILQKYALQIRDLYKEDSFE
ncbi:MAG: AMP-binding protein, partial [Bacteroidales bacterium]